MVFWYNHHWSCSLVVHGTARHALEGQKWLWPTGEIFNVPNVNGCSKSLVTGQKPPNNRQQITPTAALASIDIFSNVPLYSYFRMNRKKRFLTKQYFLNSVTATGVIKLLCDSRQQRLTCCNAGGGGLSEGRGVCDHTHVSRRHCSDSRSDRFLLSPTSSSVSSPGFCTQNYVSPRQTASGSAPI